MLPFPNLPPEILINIFSQLHFLDLFSCKRTCQRLHDIISSSLQITYQVELQIAGMQDNPYCRLPIPTRLEMLRDRELAWDSFNRKFEQNIRIPYKSSGLYDVTPGIYLLGKDDGDRTTRTIQGLPLPHQVDTTPEWDSIDFDTNVVDFGTSIEESDLLACVSLTKIEDNPGTSRLSLILRRYSTRQLYDGIASPVISLCEEPDSRGRPIISIEISGDNLAVIPEFLSDQMDPQHQFMYIYDWKTGKSKTAPIPVRNLGLVLLREDILLNPDTHNNTLNIYHIPPSSTSSSEHGVCLIQKLSLPSLNADRSITFIACRGDPSPNASFPKNTPSRRPYANNPEDAIIVFALQIGYGVEGIESSHFVMIVHRKALLDLLPSNSNLSRVPQLEPDASAIPWDLWGPPITRWLEVDSLSINFITLSAGQRFVLFGSVLDNYDGEQEEGDTFPDDFHLLDFNPWHVKRLQTQGFASSQYMTGKIIGINKLRSNSNLTHSTPEKQDGGAGEGDRTTLQEPKENICPRRDTFTADVVSKLPYVRYTGTTDLEEWEYDSMLIDEERLLGLRAGYDDGDYSLQSIDVMYFG